MPSTTIFASSFWRARLAIAMKSFGLPMNSRRRPLPIRISTMVLRVREVASCSSVMMSGRS
ncbi:hypothetical protein ACFPRL_34740 [Pseudoclavibacter helvolus]